jgi:hypothetical protein
MHIFGVVDLQYKSECGAEITLGHNRYLAQFRAYRGLQGSHIRGHIV